MRARPRRGVIPVVMVTALLAAASITLCWTPPQVGTLTLWALLALLAELMWIELPVGGVTISMASCPQFAMLLLLPRGQAMLLTALTGAVAEAYVLHKPPLRVLFNASQSALAVGAAAWAFVHAGGGAMPLPTLLARGALLPMALAACTYFALNTFSVSAIVALSEGISPVAAWRSNLGHWHETLASAALLSLGTLLAGLYLSMGIASVVLVALPVVLAFEGYRLSARLRAREQGRGRERKAA